MFLSVEKMSERSEMNQSNFPRVSCDIFNVCKLTHWSSGRRADVHLTRSVATKCHTPYHNPPHPAKNKSIYIIRIPSTKKDFVNNLHQSTEIVFLPAAARAGSVLGGEVSH